MAVVMRAWGLAVDVVATLVNIAGVNADVRSMVSRSGTEHGRRCAGWMLVALSTMFVSLGVVGCFGPTFVVAQYDGPPRPRETIAIIRMEGSDPVQLVSVDGEPLSPVEEDVRLHIEVLPGEHSVGVANLAQREQPAQRVRFLAEAGKLYGAVWTAPGNPRVFELDSSGEMLRDVSVVKPAPPPEAAPPPAPLPPVQEPERQPEPQPPPSETPPAPEPPT